jgi:hypothetical protein
MPRKKYTGGRTNLSETGARIRGKARTGAASLQHLKPKKFRDYLTLGEVAMKLGHDPRWLTRLEAAGRIPKATRVDHGKLSYRLWSPAQVEEIRTIIQSHKPGPRPKGSK